MPLTNHLAALTIVSSLALLGGCDYLPNQLQPSRSYSDAGIDLPYNPGISSCSVESRNRFIYTLMHDSYLWYDQVPLLDYTHYDDPEELLDQLIYREIDHWSYLISWEEANAYFNAGEYVGLGFSSHFVLQQGEAELELRFVYPGSPAAEAGLQRGDRIIAINGIDTTTIYNANSFLDQMGAAEAGVRVTLTHRQQGGTTDTQTLAKRAVEIKAILQEEVLEQSGVSTGYLMFNSFIATATEELNATFSRLQQANIQQLVVDLRYNPGGLDDIGLHLASLIMGNNNGTQAYNRYIHNNTHSHWNSTSYLRPVTNGLNAIERVYFLTSGESCSASEALINNLEPYVEVIQIGTPSCGKPYGMYLRPFCDLAIAAVEFNNQNSLSSSWGPEGLIPDCTAVEEALLPFGDPSEPLLAAALQHQTASSCSAVASSRQKGRPHPLREQHPYQGLKQLIRSD